MIGRMLPVTMFAAGQLSISLTGDIPPLVIIASLAVTLGMIRVVHGCKHKT